MVLSTNLGTTLAQLEDLSLTPEWLSRTPQLFVYANLATSDRSSLGIPQGSLSDHCPFDKASTDGVMQKTIGTREAGSPWLLKTRVRILECASMVERAYRTY